MEHGSRTPFVLSEDADDFPEYVSGFQSLPRFYGRFDFAVDDVSARAFHDDRPGIQPPRHADLRSGERYDGYDGPVLYRGDFGSGFAVEVDSFVHVFRSNGSESSRMRGDGNSRNPVRHPFKRFGFYGRYEPF